MTAEITESPRKPRNFYRCAGKRIASRTCVCGGEKSPGILFCTPCLADIDDQGLRRNLYLPGHAAHKFWAAVEHLSRHGSASRAPAYTALLEAGRERQARNKETRANANS
jgi:hypothetical protein